MCCRKLWTWNSVDSISNAINKVCCQNYLQGKKGVVHRGCSQPSNRRIRDEIRKRVMRLYQELYAGFGPTLYIR